MMRVGSVIRKLTLAQPSLPHDCGRCRFLGAHLICTDEETRYEDVYLCQEEGGLTVIRRYGQVDQEYQSLPIDTLRLLCGTKGDGTPRSRQTDGYASALDMAERVLR